MKKDSVRGKLKTDVGMEVEGRGRTGGGAGRALRGAEEVRKDLHECLHQAAPPTCDVKASGVAKRMRRLQGTPGRDASRGGHGGVDDLKDPKLQITLEHNCPSAPEMKEKARKAMKMIGRCERVRRWYVK
ncbi:hypothetical protein E2C01_070696 [Portunus trituberculatus]|uniref:Uncharacterized protein n=1 Tax=Portunus trituberculatus TaxID=210409 RepID=A0A5B7I472_PORTR|nr:hypothetical protein [Portunus trituberculatus]